MYVPDHNPWLQNWWTLNEAGNNTRDNHETIGKRDNFFVRQIIIQILCSVRQIIQKRRSLVFFPPKDKKLNSVEREFHDNFAIHRNKTRKERKITWQEEEDGEALLAAKGGEEEEEGRCRELFRLLKNKQIL